MDLKVENFLPESIPLRMRQLTTSFMFFYTSFLFLGYLIVKIFPICILMITEPSRTPFSKGFSVIFSVDLLLFRENSYPKSFFIQLSALLIVYCEYYITIGFFCLATSFSFGCPYFGWFSLLLLYYYWTLLTLRLRVLWLVFRLWLILRFIRSSIVPQKISSLIAPD